MTNMQEGPGLSDPAVMAREAQAIVRGIEAYLNRL